MAWLLKTANGLVRPMLDTTPNSDRGDNGARGRIGNQAGDSAAARADAMDIEQKRECQCSTGRNCQQHSAPLPIPNRPTRKRKQQEAQHNKRQAFDGMLPAGLVHENPADQEENRRNNRSPNHVGYAEIGARIGLQHGLRESDVAGACGRDPQPAAWRGRAYEGQENTTQTGGCEHNASEQIPRRRMKLCQDVPTCVQKGACNRRNEHRPGQGKAPPVKSIPNLESSEAPCGARDPAVPR
jgi:hypothetical protein